MRFLTLLNYSLLLLFSSASVSLLGQVGIGTTSPNSSAQLDVSSSSKGFLPPRIALSNVSDNSTISNPATGLLIYNTATAGTAPSNVIPGYYYWNGTKWALISSSFGNVTGIAKFYNSSNQSYSANMNIALNATEINTISDYVSLSSNGIVLEPGVYELEGSGGGLLSSGSGASVLTVGFYNNTSGAFVGQGGISASGNAGNHNGLPHNAATVMVQITTKTTLYLRVSTAVALSSVSEQSDFSTSSLGRAWVKVHKYQ